MTGNAAWAEPNSDELQQILRQTRTIAIVGVSAKPARPSYSVYRYLKSTGAYDLYLVNPMITDIEGAQAFPSLADLPLGPDMVDVFRRTEELPSVLADVLALPRRPKTLWLQQGLFDEQLAREAEAAGLRVVMDRCLKVEHAQAIRRR